MKRLTEIAIISLLLHTSGAAAQTDHSFRLVGFDAASLPTVTAILDALDSPAGSAPASAADFDLLEDGKATTTGIRTVKFGDTGMGLGLIIAIDVSQSMEGRPLNAIRQGLARLVSRKRDQDRITVMSFADDARWETRWGASATTMQDTFRNLRIRGNQTRLYDAVGQALDEFSAEAKQDPSFPSRMCILVLSDGHDEGSHTTLNQVVRRLRNSRIRLDAVGLAHSPFWLRNLQALATAGFGGFRAASNPDELAGMLSQGIDVLLDMPSYEFKTERRFGDGKSHELGVEYLPSHWRDQVAVKLSEGPWFTDRKMQFAIGSVTLVLLAIGCYFGFRRRTGSAPIGHPVQVPIQSSPPPSLPVPHRIETTAEPTSIKSPGSRSVRLPTEAEPSITNASRPVSVRLPTEAEPSMTNPPLPVSVRLPTEPEPTPAIPRKADLEAPPAKPTRVGTLLAPQTGTVSTSSSALIVETGPYAGRRVELSTGELWIGSSPNNHLCLSADPAVSGNHACIRHEDRFYRLYDNDSLNNTMINGRPIGREVILLQNGDRIRIGQSEMRLEL